MDIDLSSIDESNLWIIWEKSHKELKKCNYCNKCTNCLFFEIIHKKIKCPNILSDDEKS